MTVLLRRPLAAACVALAAAAALAWLARRRRLDDAAFGAAADAAGASAESGAAAQRVGPAWRHLEVRESLLPSAGEGLFATKNFEAGEAICDYRGVVLSLARAVQLPDKNYLMGFGLNVHVDARLAFAVPGRYVNDNFDVLLINARFEKSAPARRATLVALRDIHAGEEVYAQYGASYWRHRKIDTGDAYK
ncbi:hypothetical protein M885DRAFT_478187 [Pelagophyceae sp. CCMP2097]|nr:hypothetical protein M885DRAFT_478187 [Pelagophyceae sp. CCMP2097]